MNANPLQQLRDIHLPAAISWWPLAPGWYILITLLLLCLGLVGYWLYRKIKKGRYRRIALKSLQELYARYHQAPQESVRQLSAMLKRAVLSAYPRYQVAGLSGEAWLQFLDKTGKTNEFSQGIGNVLVNAPYQDKMKPDDVDIEQLKNLLEAWIKKNV